jgi:hypothetical protein
MPEYLARGIRKYRLSSILFPFPDLYLKKRAAELNGHAALSIGRRQVPLSDHGTNKIGTVFVAIRQFRAVQFPES